MLTSHRHLPHLYVIGQPLFVTFRLHGSLPPGRQFSNHALPSGKAFVCLDRLLDNQREGPMYLRMPVIAELVANAIRTGQTEYDLHAWVVMPNHVHLLITPHADVSTVLRRLKGRTAHEATRILDLTGAPFWQDESYDHLVRNSEEFRKIASYIIQNPVRAGLATSTDEYRWSSAFDGGLKPAAG